MDRKGADIHCWPGLKLPPSARRPLSWWRAGLRPQSGLIRLVCDTLIE